MHLQTHACTCPRWGPIRCQHCTGNLIQETPMWVNHGRKHRYQHEVLRSYIPPGSCCTRHLCIALAVAMTRTNELYPAQSPKHAKCVLSSACRHVQWIATQPSTSHRLQLIEVHAHYDVDTSEDSRCAVFSLFIRSSYTNGCFHYVL